jgi:hypothetical protein
MARVAYVPKRFAPSSELVIRQANEILDEYFQQGYDLTLRQLYYQFVARDIFPDDRSYARTAAGKWVKHPGGTKNAEPNYKWLGDIVNDARLAGRIDWAHIVDRTRELEDVTTWRSPAAIISGAASGYRRDLWETQDVRVEVWVEKEALAGVIERACQDIRVPFFACRGYTSQSAMYEASQRFYHHTVLGKRVLVLHLGDHDPSGIDMTRDIEERIRLFMAVDYATAANDVYDAFALEDADEQVENAVGWATEWFELNRLALNWDQVQQYQPPPNPAKLTDSRGAGYVAEYGDESWELDALEPTVIGDLIRDAVADVMDDRLWEEAVERESEERAVLEQASERWDDVARFLQ